LRVEARKDLLCRYVLRRARKRPAAVVFDVAKGMLLDTESALWTRAEVVPLRGANGPEFTLAHKRDGCWARSGPVAQVTIERTSICRGKGPALVERASGG